MFPKGNPRPEFSGENHPGWKGDNAGYSAKHARLPKARICENCGTMSGWIEWANLDHKCDASNPSMWVQLCRSCHKKYDYGLISIRGLTIEERDVLKVSLSEFSNFWVGKENPSKRPEVKQKISEAKRGQTRPDVVEFNTRTKKGIPRKLWKGRR